MNYCEVINNEITKYNISQPRAWGNVAFPPNATPADYLAVNLWPVVGAAPAFDPATQRCDGPVYVPDQINRLVNRVYTVRALTLNEVSEIKAAKWDEIKAERDRRTQTGGYPAAGKWFHSDTFSRTQILALVMLGANIPAGLQWKTMDGTFIAMDAALANQVFAAAATQDTATFQAAEAHKAAMEASPDPASYDYSTGWPTIYGE